MDASIRLTGTLDPRSGWTADRCSMARAFDLVRTRSALLLLREAFYGATRFADLAARAGISEPVAAGRLKELVADGLLEREAYREPGQRTRHEYRLTEKGAELLPVLVALLDWGDRWATEDGTGPIALSHAGCGAPVHAELRCGAGHAVGHGEVEAARTPRARRRG